MWLVALRRTGGEPCCWAPAPAVLGRAAPQFPLLPWMLALLASPVLPGRERVVRSPVLPGTGSVVWPDERVPLAPEIRQPVVAFQVGLSAPVRALWFPPRPAVRHPWGMPPAPPARWRRRMAAEGQWWRTVRLLGAQDERWMRVARADPGQALAAARWVPTTATRPGLLPRLPQRRRPG